MANEVAMRILNMVSVLNLMLVWGYEYVIDR